MRADSREAWDWPALLEAIRAAYASGNASAAERLICEALAAGAPWQGVADAAARGVAESPPVPPAPIVEGMAAPASANGHVHQPGPLTRPAPRRAASRWPGSGLGLLLLNGLLFLLLYPVLQLAHQAAVLLVAGLLNLGGRVAAATDLVSRLPYDPIYSAMAVQSLTDVEPLGIAVRGWLGAVLHAALPGLFLQAEATAPLVSAVFAGGNPVMAAGLSRFGADLLMLWLGLALALRGRGLRILGWLLFLDVSLRLLRFPPHLEDLEAAGLSFILYALAPTLTSRDVALSDLAAAYPEALVGLALGLATLAVAQGLVWTPLLGWRALSWLRSGRPRLGSLGLRRLRPIVATALVALVIGLPNWWAWPQPPPPEQAEFSLPPLEALAGSPAPPRARVESARPKAAVAPVVASPPPPAPEKRKPSVVRVQGGPNVFSYTVNGRPEIVRGIGYNPMLSHLPESERHAILRRDFALMRYAHINTVTGWDDREFDQLLLDVAYEHGLGVLMPFPFYPEHDYTDPEVRESIRERVHAWVQRYKDHPATRMWGLSNELLHKLIHPSWMAAKNDPEKERQGDAFADLFVQLADDLHAIDPNHPVIIRQAEESFVGPVVRALARKPRERPWVIWGGNFYNQRMGKALAWWETDGPRHALLVSEFAEGGLSQADRPKGYQNLWKLIRDRPSFVIGGAPYVWYTHGPEEVDRTFGLVGPDGKPVGGSLEAIRQMYLQDEQRMLQQGDE